MGKLQFKKGPEPDDIQLMTSLWCDRIEDDDPLIQILAVSMHWGITREKSNEVVGLDKLVKAIGSTDDRVRQLATYQFSVMLANGLHSELVPEMFKHEDVRIAVAWRSSLSRLVKPPSLRTGLFDSAN